jgi:chromate transporter
VPGFLSGSRSATSLEQPSGQPVSLKDFVLYFLRLGTLGFGGPIALTGYMQRDLVERRAWVSERDYKEGLTLAQLAPGPLAAQLAMYLGWARAGVLGATLVGVAFVGPSLVMVLALSIAYVRFGGLPWMQGVFYGIGAAVIAIIAQSAIKLTRITPGWDRFLWVVFGISVLVTAWTESEIFTLFIAAGVVTVLVREVGRGWAAAVLPLPVWIMPALVSQPAADLLWKIFLYFGQASLVVFGSGLAIIPFLHGGVVQQFNWLTERQFLDAIAVSMITPGPVVITVAFIGYLVAGLAGSLAAALGMFLPTYLAVVLAAPYYRRFADNLRVRAFVDGVTAAATGAIAGAAIVLGKRALVDLPTVLIALVTFGIMRMTKKIPDPLLIALAGIAGLLLWVPEN